jgi:hypothetical protein
MKKAKELISVIGMTRDKIVPYYVDLIKTETTHPSKEVRRVNDLILSKWSPSGLLYIKDAAWKIINEEKANPPQLVNIAVIGKFSDGTYRQILTTKTEQDCICVLLTNLSKDGRIRVREESMEGVSWSSDIDLRK